jgi:hypothetical protein
LKLPLVGFVPALIILGSSAAETDMRTDSIGDTIARMDQGTEKRTVRDFSWTELAICTLVSVLIAIPAYFRDPSGGAANLIGRIAGCFIVVILVVKAAKMIFRALRRRDSDA